MGADLAFFLAEQKVGYHTAMETLLLGVFTESHSPDSRHHESRWSH